MWERTQLPKLKMLEQIKKQSLDKLKDLISRFNWDAAGGNIQDNSSEISIDEIGTIASGGDDHNQSRSVSISRSIIIAFSRKIVNDRGQESVFSESVSTFITISSSSVFMPFL